MEELDTMLADWTLDDVLTTIRALGRTQERTPSYKTIIDELQRRFGPGTMEGIDYRWEQYVYAVRYDSLGREYVRSCTVKVFDDGTFELPKGVPYNERQLRRQGFFTGPKPDPKPKDIPEGFQELMDETFRW